MGDAPSQATVREVATALRAYVEYQRELGVLGFAPAPPATSAAAIHEGSEAPRVPSSTSNLFVESTLAGVGTLEALREHIGDCRRCKLAPHRTQGVFGVGNPRARL